MMLVDEIMTRRVQTLGPEHTLHDARQLMQSRRIRHIPVVDERGHLLGLVSQRDLLAASPPAYPPLDEAERVTREHAVRLREIMKTELFTVSADEGLRSAALKLQAHRIGCLPVLHGQVLTGIVTDTDFVAVAINLLEQLEWQAPLEFDQQED